MSKVDRAFAHGAYILGWEDRSATRKELKMCQVCNVSGDDKHTKKKKSRVSR